MAWRKRTYRLEGGGGGGGGERSTDVAAASRLACGLADAARQAGNGSSSSSSEATRPRLQEIIPEDKPRASAATGVELAVVSAATEQQPQQHREPRRQSSEQQHATTAAAATIATATARPDMAGGGRRRRRRPEDETEVSCCIKYLLFGFNVIFWIIGLVVLGVGVWAWAEKDMFDNLSKMTDFFLDPALILIIAGAVVFIIGFAGCIGALRENTCLLMFFIVCIAVILLAQVAGGILLFVYKDWVQQKLEEAMKGYIGKYRDDPDLQNVIDWLQEDWLGCCGVTSPNDWDLNVYFNCSSPSRERCGVPFSCCKYDKSITLRNKQCGYDVRKDQTTMNTYIYTQGCVDAGKQWIDTNLVPVAGVAVGLAIVEIVGICFANNMRGDILAQRAKWHN